MADSSDIDALKVAAQNELKALIAQNKELKTAHNVMVAELERLVAALAVAYEAYSAEDGKTPGQLCALGAVLDFLQDVEIAPHLQEPLMETLGELDQRIKGGKTDPKWALELAQANATVTILREAGIFLSAALAKTVQAFGEGLTAKQLNEYRKNFSRKSGKSVPAIAKTFYYQYLEKLHQVPPKRRVEAALVSLRTRRL